jgi:hypothetical protein
MRRRSLVGVAALAIAHAASAVIIDSGDGTGNTTAPAPDPGWHQVGVRGDSTAVYLGGKFAVTAAHVGPGSVTLDGVTYGYVPGTAVQLDNGDGTFADLVMFQLYPAPPLPALAIATAAPANGTAVILAGNGANRGAATSFDPNGPDDPPPVGGYQWAADQTLRWGTNAVSGRLRVLLAETQTESIQTVFDSAGSAHEAAATVGDSGGALFVWDGSAWRLGGILYAIGALFDQPPQTTLYGNTTYSADLSSYREQIQDVIATPEPCGALWPGVAAVAALARRRRPR